MRFHFRFYYDFGRLGTLTSTLPAPSPTLPSAADLPAEVYQAARLGWMIFISFCEEGRFAPAADECIGDATDDLAEILLLAANEPAHWRLAVGPESGVFVLLVEGELGRDSLCGLCGSDWGWQRTLQAESGDVRYMFFRWPDRRTIRGAARELWGGIQVLADGDSAPIPSSKGCPGVPRSYLDPDASVEPAPEWLLDYAFTSEADDAATAPHKPARGVDSGTQDDRGEAATG